jgi:general secretion pathway protein I
MKAPLPSRRALGGFTLLEVMVAVTILGLSLTAIFSSEAGAVKVANRARRTSVATVLARCKLGEIEEKVLREGLPAVSASGGGSCCEDATVEGFECEWSIDRVVLPDAPEVEDDDATAAGGPGGATADAGGVSVQSLLAGGGPSGSSMANLAMQYTYPVLKPTIEEQVRRATVTVKWREGRREQSFSVVQYLVADAPTIPGSQP